MGRYLNSTDLPSDVGGPIGLRVDDMIDDAEARALLAAPCLAVPGDLTEDQRKAVKAILRGALMRWSDAGTGVVQSESSGTLSTTVDTTIVRRGLFWPSEVAELQKICSDGQSGKVFAVDTAGFGPVHADACSVNFGAAYCSCGADIAGFPLWET